MREVVLKPCPFCGEVPGIEQTESGYSGPEDAITATFQVRCEICGVGFERKTRVTLDKDGKPKVLSDGRKEAIGLWNMRSKRK